MAKPGGSSKAGRNREKCTRYKTAKRREARKVARITRDVLRAGTTMQLYAGRIGVRRAQGERYVPRHRAFDAVPAEYKPAVKAALKRHKWSPEEGHIYDR